MSDVKQRDWQKIYLTAFAKMDSDQPGEAEAALHQVRKIHAQQGIGFRNIINQLENTADPAELVRLRERIADVEAANATLGLQNRDLYKENFRLRKLCERYSPRMKFISAAHALLKNARVKIGQGITFRGTHLTLKDNAFTLSTLSVSTALYLGNVATTPAQILFVLAGANAAGFVRSGIKYFNNIGDVGRIAARKALWRVGATALFLGSAHYITSQKVAAQQYDRADINVEAQVKRMYAAGNMGPETFRENYRVSDSTYVYTLVGKTYDIDKAAGSHDTESSGNLQCTLYWYKDEKVKKELAATTTPALPDRSYRPDYQFGTCRGLINLMYGN